VPGNRRRTIDIAFPRGKLAVFVDGCFWHGCPEHGRVPGSNHTWWTEKIRRNCQRDANTAAHLERLGWQVLRIWEHVPPRQAAFTVRERLRSIVAPDTN
jgi:DNA mismatch endonuclease (patch repair protein)